MNARWRSAKLGWPLTVLLAVATVLGAAPGSASAAPGFASAVPGSGFINTVAGSKNNSGFAGNGGPATSAAFSNVVGVAVDAGGNVFIADGFNNDVRRVDAATHVVQTVAGNETLGAGFSGDGMAATSAQLNGPNGVAVDAAGNLFIADTGNNVIREVDAGTQIIHTVAGDNSLGAGFSGDGMAASSAQLNGPFDVTVDAAGNLFITDSNNNVVRKVDATTKVIHTIAGNNSLGAGFSGDGMAATAAQLNFPAGVTVDSARNVFIADGSNNRIRKVDATTQTITTVAGGGTTLGDGGNATSAQLNLPLGIALDGAGSLFIADYLNNRIREVQAATGVISTVAGNGTAGFSGDGGPATQAKIDSPYDVAVDASGDIFVADNGNNSVREVFPPTGVVPAVSGVAPSEGPLPGGTPVTISGTGFDTRAGATFVRFGSTPSTGPVTCSSPTSCTASSPAGTGPGPVDVTVSTPGGTSAISNTDTFTYTVPAPVVTSVSPMSGPGEGSTTVTITGTDLKGATAVHFGANAVTQVNLQSCSATTCTVASPPGAGVVDVTVTTPGGTSATGPADKFAYVPTVSALSPTGGPPAGGTTVTVTGAGFLTAPGATTIAFGSTAATGVSCASTTTCTATSPAGTVNTAVDVTVTTAGGTSATSPADKFAYLPVPTVSSVTPAGGSAAGGTTVSITGTGFPTGQGATRVDFGGIRASGVTCSTTTSCTATSPVGSAGTVDVTVTTAGGISPVSPGDKFTFTTSGTPPTILVVGAGCTLADAVAEANTGAAPAGSGCTPPTGNGPWVIKVPTGGSTLTQVASGFNGRDGLAPIIADVTVESATPGTLAPITAAPAAGAPTFRIFDVEPTGNLHLLDVKLSGGAATGGNGADGGAGGAGLGGAIFSNGGTVSVVDSQLSANKSVGGAGSTFVTGTFGG
ncbi:MAG: IPT/TIG domain-containing protein, partial [Actinomycetota bacterium]|nr:IPT/TIG domain-containing protein [Actinomycetota bacterium]